MLTFHQFLSEANNEVIDLSWVYNPKLGVESEKGWHKHYGMKYDYPEHFENWDDRKREDFFIGWARIDRKAKAVYVGIYPNWRVLNTATSVDTKNQIKSAIKDHFSKRYKTTNYQYRPLMWDIINKRRTVTNGKYDTSSFSLF